jgi:isoamylase
LGNFPPGFSEWNDRYRDSVRRYWRGDAGMRPELASRLAGSSDLFDPKRPHASINYVACHDGFTLHDLVSYESKHNLANGEDNRDGASDNFSANYGAEGETEDPAIAAYRERVKRAMLATLLTSLGTPMIQMGDECGRSQKGNNNAYCQDNELTWLDWSLMESDPGKALTDFVARLTELRRQHITLHDDHYPDGEAAPGLARQSWWDERGIELSPADWNNSEGRILCLRRAAPAGNSRIEVTALLLNADSRPVSFQLPGDLPWRLALDSANPQATPSPVAGSYEVADRAAVLLVADIAA